MIKYQSFFIAPFLGSLKAYEFVKKTSIAVMACGLFFNVDAHSENLRIAFGEFKPPYVFGQEGKGLEVDIVREALKHKGHSLTVVHIPDNRRYKSLPSGTLKLDGAASLEIVNDGYFYSKEFISYEDYAITRKEDKLIINNISDLQNKSVVAWQNAWAELGNEYRELFAPGDDGLFRKNYYEHSSQRAQVEMFWRKRVEVVVMDNHIFNWITRHQLGINDKVNFNRIFPPQTSYKIAFIDRRIRDEFDEGLELLIRSGNYQKIVNGYLIDD